MSTRSFRGPFAWLSGLALLRHPTVQIVYASSLMMIMGTDLLYPVMPALLNPLGVSAARVGMIISAFTAPGIFLSPIVGALADLYGRKKIFVLGLLFYGCAGLAMAAAPSFSVILFLRALQGVAYIGVMPLVVVLLGDHFQQSQETSAQGFKVFFDRFGSFLFPALGGMLAALSWRLPFLLYGLAIPVSLAAWLWLPESQLRRGIPLKEYIRSIVQLVRFGRSLSIFWPIGGFLFIYGLGNGIISPCQKSLITQSAPAELRAGMVAADRVVQSIGKSLAPVFSSLILLTGNIQWIFASLGLIAFAGASGLAFLKRGGVLQPRSTVVKVS